MQATPTPIRAKLEQGSVEVAGEQVRYDIYAVDARTQAQRAQDAQRGRPAGHIMVVVPGHGQTVHGPRNLVTTAALLSRSKIAWCIDPVPTRGGDRTEGRAIAAIVRHRLAARFAGPGDPVAAPGPAARATLIGWSHGGSEALCAAGDDPLLFPQFLGLAPTGLVARRPPEFLTSFFLEALQVVGASLRRRDWAYLREVWRVGWNLTGGLLHDLVRSRSPRRLLEDVRQAGCAVAGPAFPYPGEVALLFGSRDSVIRWQDLFPGCAQPDQIAACLPAYQQAHFPQAQRLVVRVVEGDHLAPEARAVTFLRPGLTLLGQLDDAE